MKMDLPCKRVCKLDFFLDLLRLRVLNKVRDLTVDNKTNSHFETFMTEADSKSQITGEDKDTIDKRYLRPSSDVVLLPCRTKLQFGSTVARQEIYSDSDVVPESNQIQGLLEPRNNSPPNSPRERNLARTY